MANALTKIKSGAIGADAIDSSDFAAASIDNEHLADNAVGLAEMASGTDGQIITYDASGDPVAVGPGTDGQVLTSTGAGSPPAFEDAAGGAALTGSTNNTVVTVTGANAIAGEANLTFDGTDLGVGGTRKQTYSSSGGTVITSYNAGANGGAVEVGSTSNSNAANAGSIFFINDANSDATAINSAGSKVLGMQRVETVTSDSNAGDDSGGDIAFYTKAEAGGNAETLRLKSNRDVSVAGGNIIIGTSGKGIDFSATAGSGTSELFDDYEEGTMTLGLTGTTGAPSAGVQNSAVGYYTKIGNSVHCTVYFNGVNMSGVTGTIELTGLPFTVSSTGHHHVIPVEMVHSVNWSSGDKHAFYTTSNGTTATGIKSIANAAWQNWSSGDWAASITYYTDFYFRTDS